MLQQLAMQKISAAAHATLFLLIFFKKLTHWESKQAFPDMPMLFHLIYSVLIRVFTGLCLQNNTTWSVLSSLFYSVQLLLVTCPSSLNRLQVLFSVVVFIPKIVLLLFQNVVFFVMVTLTKLTWIIFLPCLWNILFQGSPLLFIKLEIDFL